MLPLSAHVSVLQPAATAAASCPIACHAVLVHHAWCQCLVVLQPLAVCGWMVVPCDMLACTAQHRRCCCMGRRAVASDMHTCAVLMLLQYI